MKIKVSIKPGDLPARAEDLRRVIEHVIDQHCGESEILMKARSKKIDIHSKIKQGPKKLEYKVLETSVIKSRKNVKLAKAIMLKKIDAILAEVH